MEFLLNTINTITWCYHNISPFITMIIYLNTNVLFIIWFMHTQNFAGGRTTVSYYQHNHHICTPSCWFCTMLLNLTWFLKVFCLASRYFLFFLAPIDVSMQSKNSHCAKLPFWSFFCSSWWHSTSKCKPVGISLVSHERKFQHSNLVIFGWFTSWWLDFSIMLYQHLLRTLKYREYL